MRGIAASPSAALPSAELLGALLSLERRDGLERDHRVDIPAERQPPIFLVTRDNYVVSAERHELGPLLFKINTFHLKAHREAWLR
jgi:hypothetical protein